jgi:hypothetical protein
MASRWGQWNASSDDEDVIGARLLSIAGDADRPRDRLRDASGVANRNSKRPTNVAAVKR